MTALPILETYIKDYIVANGGFVSLHTGLPTNANEVAGGSYARRPVAYSVAGSEPTVMTNTAMVEFAVATADWGVVTHYAIHSAATGGNMIARTELADPKNITVGDVVRFAPGDLIVRID